MQSENLYSVEVGAKKKPLPKPKWMKASIPGGEKDLQIKKKLECLTCIPFMKKPSVVK